MYTLKSIFSLLKSQLQRFPVIFVDEKKSCVKPTDLTNRRVMVGGEGIGS